MEARELRLGNLVELEGLVSRLNNTTFTSIISGRYKDLNPVHLTEEWLLKFGFEKVREYFDYNNNGFEIQKDKNGFYIHINCGNIYIEYLHQLQNLYFALTGEELTLSKTIDSL